MMNTGKVSPIPKMKRPSGIQAMPEIGRRSSTSGSMNAFASRLSPIAKPSGTASATATARLTTSRVTLTSACSNNSPSAASAVSASRTRSGDGSWIGLAFRTESPYQEKKKREGAQRDEPTEVGPAGDETRSGREGQGGVGVGRLARPGRVKPRRACTAKSRDAPHAPASPFYLGSEAN